MIENLDIKISDDREGFEAFFNMPDVTGQDIQVIADNVRDERFKTALQKLDEILHKNYFSDSDSYFHLQEVSFSDDSVFVVFGYETDNTDKQILFDDLYELSGLHTALKEFVDVCFTWRNGGFEGVI